MFSFVGQTLCKAPLSPVTNFMVAWNESCIISYKSNLAYIGYLVDLASMRRLLIRDSIAFWRCFIFRNAYNDETCLHNGLYGPQKNTSHSFTFRLQSISRCFFGSPFFSQIMSCLVSLCVRQCTIGSTRKDRLGRKTCLVSTHSSVDGKSANTSSSVINFLVALNFIGHKSNVPTPLC